MNARPIFRIVIGYEQATAAIHARQIVNRLVATLKGEFEVCSDMWKFDLIGYPRLSDQAIEAVADAEMLIIAIDGDMDLPGPVKTWIESWAFQGRDRRRTLVALLGHNFEPWNEPLPLQLILQRMATEGGKEFFCYHKDSSFQTFCSTVGSIHRDVGSALGHDDSRSGELSAGSHLDLRSILCQQAVKEPRSL